MSLWHVFLVCLLCSSLSALAGFEVGYHGKGGWLDRPVFPSRK